MRPATSRATPCDRLAGALSVVGLLVLWELTSRYLWRDPQILPAPSEALAAAARFLGPWDLLGHVSISLMRIFAGFALAAVLGVSLGIVLGWSPRTARCVRPFVEILRPIPPLAWLPLAIIWFGLGEPSKVFVIFLGAFFPIFTSAWRGMTMVSPTLIRAAQTMDVDGARLLWQVAIPATLPDIAAGLRVGFGLSFGILVAAELIAAKSGMGYLVMESRQLGQLGVAIFGIFLIGIVNLVADHQMTRIIRATVGRWSNV
jgi:ABC-type nitrate/sulfonate/bicarbonate transport system permease component